jgi:hypothetical protein
VAAEHVVADDGLAKGGVGALHKVIVNVLLEPQRVETLRMRMASYVMGDDKMVEVIKEEVMIPVGKESRHCHT